MPEGNGVSVDQIEVGDIVWAFCYRENLVPVHYRPHEDLPYTTQVRARVVEIQYPPGFLLVQYGSMKDAWLNQQMVTPLDPVDMLAGADESCPFCLGTGYLISKLGDEFRIFCESCRPKFDSATFQTGPWVIPLTATMTVSNGQTIMMKYEHLIATTEPQPVRDPKNPGPGRWHPKVSREEAARRRREAAAHSRRFR